MCRGEGGGKGGGVGVCADIYIYIYIYIITYILRVEGRGRERAIPTDLMAWSEEILVTRTDLDEKNQVRRGGEGNIYILYSYTHVCI
jgi:hypothetical protein